MNTDLIRFIDSISRDKAIDKESVFADLEAAIVSAARKHFGCGEEEEASASIDRQTGVIEAFVAGKPIDMQSLGRIAAQTAKQVMIQRIREDERNSIFDEYSQLVGTIVTGTVTRYEGGGLTVNLGRVEAFMPRSEQIPGQMHHPGERIRGMILDVREETNQVRIVLTQTHPDYIRKLFELEVPEVAEKVIEVRALAREAGYRTKIAVSSIDMKVDPVGACVGVRGSRIRNIVDELGGEKIDIVRWNESSQVLISNALKPAEVKETFLCFELGRATVVVDEDQLSLAIGKRGQNVRLGARLTGWDIDILTPADYDRNMDGMERVLKIIDGVDDVLLDKLLAMGVISVADVKAVGADPLTNELGVDPELAKTMVEAANGAADALAAEAAEAKKLEQESRESMRSEFAGAGPSLAEKSVETAEAGATEVDATEIASAEIHALDGGTLETADESPVTDVVVSPEAEVGEPVVEGNEVKTHATGTDEELEEQPS